MPAAAIPVKLLHNVADGLGKSYALACYIIYAQYSLQSTQADYDRL